MESLVIYFSQSGNTRKIAEAVRQGISRLVRRCDIARLQDVKEEELPKYDLIALGSPVWMSRPAFNMLAFIEKANLPEDKQYFYFCTHGTMPGETISVAVSALRNKDLTVIGWQDWYGGVFLPYMPKPYYTDGHPDAIDLQEADKFGQKMVKRSLRITAGESGLIPSLPKGKNYIDIYGENVPDINTQPAEFIKARTREFVINMQKCTQCGLCADNCPTDNIDLSVSPPVFRKRDCGRCWYCEQICPFGAIEYDWGLFSNMMRKYSLHEFEITLMCAEAMGRFRRLVPLEKIGWDTPWYKISGRPRLQVQ